MDNLFGIKPLEKLPLLERQESGLNETWMLDVRVGVKVKSVCGEGDKWALGSVRVRRRKVCRLVGVGSKAARNFAV